MGARPTDGQGSTTFVQDGPGAVKGPRQSGLPFRAVPDGQGKGTGPSPCPCPMPTAQGCGPNVGQVLAVGVLGNPTDIPRCPVILVQINNCSTPMLVGSQHELGGTGPRAVSLEPPHFQRGQKQKGVTLAALLSAVYCSSVQGQPWPHKLPLRAPGRWECGQLLEVGPPSRGQLASGFGQVFGTASATWAPPLPDNPSHLWGFHVFLPSCKALPLDRLEMGHNLSVPPPAEGPQKGQICQPSCLPPDAPNLGAALFGLWQEGGSRRGVFVMPKEKWRCGVLFCLIGSWTPAHRCGHSLCPVALITGEPRLTRWPRLSEG